MVTSSPFTPPSENAINENDVIKLSSYVQSDNRLDLNSRFP